MSSLRLFKVATCGLDIIKNFSEMHKLHRLVRVVYALAFARIFHVIVKSFFFSFKCHRYLLSSVSFFLFSCLNDICWFLHLVLNSVAVRPIYVSVFSLVVTLAWYTTSFSKHSPFNGHLSAFLQCTFLWLCVVEVVLLSLRCFCCVRLLFVSRLAYSCSLI